jgi:DNA-binding response OmpR family regulator
MIIVVKPFSPREVVARVRTIFRRTLIGTDETVKLSRLAT